MAGPPEPVVRLLGIRHHGPGSARSVVAALDALDPEVVCIEGPPEAEPVLDLAADPHGPADRPPGLRPGPADPGLVLAARRVQPGVAGAAVGAARTAARCGSSISRPRTRWLGRDEDADARRRVRDPLRAAGRRGRVRRRRALVGRPGRARRRATSSRPSWKRWPRSGRPARRPGPREAAARGGDAPGAGRGRSRRGSAGSRSCAGPGTSPRCRRAAERRRRGRARGACAKAEGGHDLGAVVEPPPGRGERLRRRRAGARLVRPPVPPRRTGGHRPLVLRGGGACSGPAATRPRRPRSSTPPGWPRRWRRCAAVPSPGLAEVTDAAAAVLGEGGAAPMALVQEDLVVGTAVGSVPDDTPMVPLARDLAASQRRLRLKLEDRTLELDLRRPDAAGPVAPAPPAVAPRRAVGTAGRGPRRGGDLPGDVAAALGARAGGSTGRAERVRHHGRGGRRGLRRAAGRRRGEPGRADPGRRGMPPGRPAGGARSR